MDDDLPIQLEMFLERHAIKSISDVFEDEDDDDQDPDVVAVDTFFDENGEPNF
jgi:hypothetical protein